MAYDLLIAFEQLDRVPAQQFVRNGSADLSLDPVQDILHLLRKGRCRCNARPSLRCGYGHRCRLVRTLVPDRRNLHDLAAQELAQLPNIDHIPILAHQIHHVDRYNNRDPQLEKLCRQIQIAFNIGSVDNVQNGMPSFFSTVTPGQLPTY